MHEQSLIKYGARELINLAPCSGKNRLWQPFIWTRRVVSLLSICEHMLSLRPMPLSRPGRVCVSRKCVMPPKILCWPIGNAQAVTVRDEH